MAFLISPLSPLMRIKLLSGRSTIFYLFFVSSLTSFFDSLGNRYHICGVQNFSPKCSHVLLFLCTVHVQESFSLLPVVGLSISESRENIFFIFPFPYVIFFFFFFLRHKSAQSFPDQRSRQQIEIILENNHYKILVTLFEILYYLIKQAVYLYFHTYLMLDQHVCM